MLHSIQFVFVDRDQFYCLLHMAVLNVIKLVLFIKLFLQLSSFLLYS
jgi:hypothetical protein